MQSLCVLVRSSTESAQFSCVARPGLFQNTSTVASRVSKVSGIVTYWQSRGNIPLHPSRAGEKVAHEGSYPPSSSVQLRRVFCQRS